MEAIDEEKLRIQFAALAMFHADQETIDEWRDSLTPDERGWVLKMCNDFLDAIHSAAQNVLQSLGLLTKP